jgi:hypothetical protein
VIKSTEEIRNELVSAIKAGQSKALYSYSSVYIIAAEYPKNRYKIGLTRKASAQRRLKEILTYSPVNLTLAHVIECGAKGIGRTVETLLHKLYSDKRCHGEWFDLNDQDIKWIKSL